MTKSALEQTKAHRSFGGTQGYYTHDSQSCGVPMNLSVYVPPQAERGPCPAVLYLSGLTCTEDNVTVKAGAQRVASELGLIFVAPDTSPRGLDLPGEHDSYDFGSGAGFYVDATESPWRDNYRMYSYVTEELPALIEEHFPIAGFSVTGHSMGGHGALVVGLRNPQRFRSISAFAPICAPSQCPWGQKALGGYLGSDQATWADYDATALVARQPRKDTILIDQGLDDQFLAEQLMPERFEEACEQVGQGLKLRRHAGYDHSYFFIASLIEDHLRFHAEAHASGS